MPAITSHHPVTLSHHHLIPRPHLREPTLSDELQPLEEALLVAPPPHQTPLRDLQHLLRHVLRTGEGSDMKRVS